MAFLRILSMPLRLAQKSVVFIPFGKKVLSIVCALAFSVGFRKGFGHLF